MLCTRRQNISFAIPIPTVVDQSDPGDETVTYDGQRILTMLDRDTLIDSPTNPKSKNPNRIQPNQSNHRRFERTQVRFVMALVSP